MLKNKILIPETKNYFLIKELQKGISLFANKGYQISEVISKK